MTALRAGPSSRALRTTAKPAIRWGLALFIALSAGGATAAGATTAITSPPGTSVSDLQIQAQELAGQIAANGRTLDELSASYEAAQIQFGHLQSKQAALFVSMLESDRAVAAARQTVKEQAVLAYVTGGGPVINFQAGRPGVDPSLTQSYAEIIAGGQQDAIRAYRASINAQAQQKRSLDANGQQLQITLQTIHSDEQRAQATLAAQQKALSQVKGQLAVEVAKVQAQRQAAQQQAERAALAAQGDLPPANPPPAPSTSTSTTTQPARTTTTVTRSGSDPTTTTSPPTTAGPPPTTSPPTTTQSGPPPPQAPDARAALDYARAQLGKPYQWGGAGPDSFDCSGLTMMAWEQAGIYFPHLAQDQYNLTARIPLSDLLPGDLVFFGTPDNVYHVGIYIGNSNMIDAPETGQNVSVASIYWDNLLGAGRVTVNS